MTKAVDFLRSQGIEPKPYQWDDPDFFKRDSQGRPRAIKHFEIRDEFIAQFGFAILSEPAIEAIRAHAPIVEVGAGCGYWSYELRQAGIEVVATEPEPGTKWGSIPRAWKPWLEMEKLSGREAVLKYPNHSLLMCWPSLNDDWPFVTLGVFQGSTVLYVGEGDGGCTADDKFHELLDSKFNEIQTVAIPQFWGLHDYLSIWKRKGARTISLEA